MAYNTRPAHPSTRPAHLTRAAHPARFDADHPRPAVLATALLIALAGCSARQPRFDLPGLVLWAWERPEDLRFLDPHRAGIAFLAATARIEADGRILFRPRTQSLLLPAGIASIAVVRIESPAQHAVPEAAPLVDGLRRIAAMPDVRGLQIDFDARLSEREFYRTLLASLWRVTNKPIGITALASWCSGDRWLDREPIGEAVPMFFRMGRNESRNMIVDSAVCRAAIGVSMDEPWPKVRPPVVDRIYVFNPRAWTQADYLAAQRRVQAWK